MICIYIFARSRKETLLCRAYTVPKLFFTRWMTKICGRTSYIMDVSLKIFFFNHLFRFFYKRFMTSDLYNTPLVKCKRTETASSETSPVADQAEADLRNCRDSSFRFIRRMISPHIRQIINIIHFCNT